MKHIQGIDGLRAVAVLAVVAYHAGLPVPAGFVGVDVFFVISGYLITRLLHDEVQATGRIDFMGFYARRARRILPALVAVVLVTLALSALLLGSVGDVASSAAAASAFVANVFFQAHTGGYWSPDAEAMPLLHLWSLSVEEQFYLVWPAVLILARRKPVAALAVLAVASLALAEWWLWREPSAAFYQMPSRAWELALGGLVALRPVNVPKGSAWIGLAAVLLACFVPFTHFPGIGALPAVAGSALLIAGIQNGQRIAPLEWRPVVFVGLISYSLYLWHWPLLALAHATHVGEVPALLRVELVALAFLLAVVSYRYVETPFRKVRASHRRAVVVGMSCALLLSGGALAFSSQEPVDGSHDWPTARETCYQPLGSQPRTETAPCQNRKGRPEVVLWGDSLALAWQPFAFAMAKNRVAVMYSRGACPPQMGFTLSTATETANCSRFLQSALNAAKAAKVVILASAWEDRFTPERRDESRQELEATLAGLAGGPRVIIIGPTPTLMEDAPKCFRLHERCAITRAQFEDKNADANAALRSLATKYHATVIDPSGFFCADGQCAASRDGYALYWDNRHVSRTAASAFAAEYLNRATW